MNPGSNGGSTSRAVASFVGTVEDSGIAVDPAIVAILGLSGTYNFFLSDLSVTVSNANSYQVVITRDGSPIVTLVVTSPGGQEVVSSAADGTPPATGGVLIDFHVNPLTNPPSNFFQSIVSGTYNHFVSVLAPPGSAFNYSGSVIAKNDSNLGAGRLKLKVFLVGSFAQSNVSAVNTALSVASSIYAARGITVDADVFSVSGGNSIPDPAEGDVFYLSNINSDAAVNVFMGETIDAVDNNGLLLGRAGGAPGAQVPTIKSIVGIDMGNHAGANGIFNGDEPTTMGGTIAHEVGHFLGLFHPVEIQTIGSNLGNTTFVLGDTLTDTPSCTVGSQCIANGAVNNLMFPLSDPSFTQETLSLQQGQVMNLQPVMD
ncbi:MAG: hypothetical protein KDD66_10205 [Bdellovibrionales bacterium]|nr:hypothetical protein [Bdellovibrionales bacterium]